MRYSESENPYIITRFATSDTVTIDIYDLSDNSLEVDGALMSEVGSTGYFKYQFNPTVTSLKEYLYIATNGTEEHAGKIVLGGYPDDIKDETEIILKVQKNAWKIIDNQMIIYDDDGTTPLYTFNLKDSTGTPSSTEVYERTPV